MSDHYTWINELVGKLYEEHRDSLKRYISSKGASEDLDDIVNDVFLRFHIKMRVLSQEEIKCIPYLSYLRSIARNHIVDLHRRKKRTGPIDHLSEMGSNDDSGQDTIVDDAPRPEDLYEEKERKERLERAIDKLPEKWRIAVQGFYEGQKMGEIGQEIGIGAAAVGYRLRNAWAILRNMPDIQQMKNDH